MDFLTPNIDRSIVTTQYDLRGFVHPIGCRIEGRTAKGMFLSTLNFMAFAAGLGHEDARPTDSGYVNWRYSSFEDYLAMCQRLAANCDASQTEAIQLIIRDIVKQSEEMKAEQVERQTDEFKYLPPLAKGNPWGMAVIALADAFSVTLEQVCA